MSEFNLYDLIPRLDGWRIVSIVTQGDMTEIRVASSFEDAPKWLVARGAVFVAGIPENLGDDIVVGSVMKVNQDGISAGPWLIDNDSLVAGQMLESAIILVSGPPVDPVKEPATTADLVVDSGTVVWPMVTDLPEELRGIELLDGINRLALTQPSLVTSVVVEADTEPTRAWDTFVTPFGAVETERHLDTEEQMAVSYFPLSDLPSRLWERTGIARLIAPGAVSWNAQNVSVRSTFMDEHGLVAGALVWEESKDGELSTGDEPISVLSLASELLRMLPGGDIDFESASKEVVGKG